MKTASSIEKDSGKESEKTEDGQYEAVYAALREKVHRLEDKMKVLNALPSNPQLLESQGLTPIPSESRTGPTVYLFQLLKVQKQVDANSTAIDKVIFIQ